MSSTPPLSVIVINHQGGARLAAALASVWEQRFVTPEIIVVDRGSTDESRGWLEAHRARVTKLELAEGAAHFEAANRALAAATGEWVFLLGCRDRLVGDMILSESLNWMKKTEAGVVAGESAADDGRLMKLHSHVNALARDFLPVSATFYRRTLFAEHDPFDPTLASLAPYDLHVRLWKSRVRFKPIPLRVAACSARPPFGWAEARAEMRARHRYFAAWRCWPWDALSLLRCLGPQPRADARGPRPANMR